MSNRARGYPSAILSMLFALSVACVSDKTSGPTVTDDGSMQVAAGVYTFNAYVSSSPAWDDLTGYRYSADITITPDPGNASRLNMTVQGLEFVSPDGGWRKAIPAVTGSIFISSGKVFIEIRNNSGFLWRGSGSADAARIQGDWEGDNAIGAFTALRANAR
jgi:hypothetical protein